MDVKLESSPSEFIIDDEGDSKCDKPNMGVSDGS